LIVIGAIGLFFDLGFQAAIRISCQWASQKRS
jgi:NitT/TauT family transport system permease protein